MAIVDQGVVLQSGEPAAAVEALRGLVWRKLIANDELPDYKGRRQVLSGSLLAGRVLVHVLSRVTPGRGFEAAEPGLEDVYFVITVLLGAPFTLVVGFRTIGQMYDTATWPVTYVVVESVNDLFSVFVLAVIMYSGGLVWRDRDRP